MILHLWFWSWHIDTYCMWHSSGQVRDTGSPSKATEVAACHSLEFDQFRPAGLGLASMWLRLWTEVFVPTYYNGPSYAATCAGCFLSFSVVSVALTSCKQSLWGSSFQDAVFFWALRDGRTCSTTCEFQAPQIRACMALSHLKLNSWKHHQWMCSGECLARKDNSNHRRSYLQNLSSFWKC